MRTPRNKRTLTQLFGPEPTKEILRIKAKLKSTYIRPLNAPVLTNVDFLRRAIRQLQKTNRMLPDLPWNWKGQDKRTKKDTNQ